MARVNACPSEWVTFIGTPEGVGFRVAIVWLKVGAFKNGLPH
jgi:hypothetical protein